MNLVSSQYLIQAIVLEVNIMKSLNSQNIIKCLEVIESTNTIYIVQEFANNGTLKDLIKVCSKEERTYGFICELANGFSTLIKQGIVHRDLKPENILIKNGQLKIADFGLSKFADKVSVLNTCVGTPPYMAPQVLSSNCNQYHYSYKCDIWSFGVVCF